MTPTNFVNFHALIFFANWLDQILWLCCLIVSHVGARLSQCKFKWPPSAIQVKNMHFACQRWQIKSKYLQIVPHSWVNGKTEPARGNGAVSFPGFRRLSNDLVGVGCSDISSVLCRWCHGRRLPWVTFGQPVLKLECLPNFTLLNLATPFLHASIYQPAGVKAGFQTFPVC